MIDSTKMLYTINEAQQRFINSEKTRDAFDCLLLGLIELTGSEYGFIGEVLYKTPTQNQASSNKKRIPYLKTYAISNIAWNDDTRSFYDEFAPEGLEFLNLNTLFGEVMKTGEMVISNHPGNDSRGGGVPAGHPPLNAFLGVPLYNRDAMIGMAGISNRENGYDKDLVEELKPFLNTCAQLVYAYRVSMEADVNAQKLRDSENRQAAILDTIIDGVITIDKVGTIASFNPAAEKIFGYSAEEVIGENVKLLMPVPYASEHDKYMQNYLDTGEAKVIGIGREVQGRRKNGITFPLDLAISELHVGGDLMFTGLVRDITERKRSERIKNEFISLVSHELRTPLTSIRGSLGLINGGAVGELPEQAKEMLKIASNNTERLLLLINDILDIQKIESGKMAFRFQHLELKSFLQQAIRDCQSYADQYGVSFVLNPYPNRVQVYADEDRLMQVMNNLMSNAAKFSNFGDVVEVSIARHSGAIRVSVSDHGVGIAESFRDKLFEKFTQSDSSDTRQKSGTGLGLNITQLIIEKHGGRIDYISQEGVGSTFFIELPELLTELVTEYSEDGLPPALARPHGPCLLIVEDDPDVAALLQRMLAESGFNTDIAYTAAQARELLNKRGASYRAMTLDILLPDEDGIELLNSLRQQAKTKDLPVVIISVKADEAKRQLNGGAVGVLDWLSKPIDQNRLLKVVRELYTNNKRPRVLYVEDDSEIYRVVSLMLKNECDLVWCSTLSSSKQILCDEEFDLVLLDIGLPDGSGLELLELIERYVKPPRVVIFSAQEVDDNITKKVSAALVKSKASQQELLHAITSAMR